MIIVRLIAFPFILAFYLVLSVVWITGLVLGWVVAGAGNLTLTLPNWGGKTEALSAHENETLKTMLRAAIEQQERCHGINE